MISASKSISFFLCVLFSSFFACISIGAEERVLWRSFSCSESDEKTILAALDKLHIESLGVDNATVEISDFSGLESVRVSELSSRLDTSDPRWDPYLLALPKLFSPSGAIHNSKRFVWVKTQDSSHAEQVLRDAGMNFEWTTKVNLAGVSGSLEISVKILSWMAWFGFFTAFFLALRKKRFLEVLVFLVLSLGIFFFSEPSLAWVALMMSFAMLDRFVEQMARFQAKLDSRPIFPWTPIALLSLGLSFLVVQCFSPSGSWWDLFFWSLSLAVCIGLNVLRLKVRARSLSSVEHGLFRPVSLRPKKKGLPKLGRFWKTNPQAVVLFVVAFSIFVFTDGSHWVGGPSSLSNPLFAFNGIGDKLDTALYERHRWYQEGFPFGAVWKNYTPGVRIFLPTYRNLNGKIQEQDRLILEVGDPWWAGVMKGLERSNAARLILNS